MRNHLRVTQIRGSVPDRRSAVHPQGRHRGRVGTLQDLCGQEGVTNLLVGKSLQAQAETTARRDGSAEEDRALPAGSAERPDGRDDWAIVARNLRPGNGCLPQFVVRYGEIVGIGGVEGAGGIELMEALAGLREWTADESRGHGRDDCPPTPVRAVRDGIIFLPPDRKEEGIFFDATITENMAVGEDIAARCLWGSVWWGRAVGLYRELQRRLLIKAQNEVQPCGRLSGGNQQKALFGRAIASDARVWLLAEPTRGIDVGARVEIYRLMREEAVKGKAIVVRSIDPGELSAVCDRCYVLSPSGRVTELHGADVTSEGIYAACYDRDDLMLAAAERYEAAS
jgi:ABC-type sugar transport system ATPase subunit